MDVIIGPFILLLMTVVNLYFYAVIISVILSWLVAFNVVNQSNRFIYLVGDFLYRITEPVLGRIRKFLPNLGNLDISPIVLILLLYFLENVLANLLRKIG